MTTQRYQATIKQEQNHNEPAIVGMAPELQILTLRQQLQMSDLALANEKRLRAEAEQKLADVLADRDANWVRKVSKEEQRRLRDEQLALKQERQITGLKSDGKSIARPAEEFRSYTEMQNFLNMVKRTGRLGVRNWAMVRVGICFGLRISDLVRIKWCWLLKPDGTWKERFVPVEKKTQKNNDILITDAVKETLTEYMQWLGGYDLNGYVFAKTNGGQMSPKHASQILVDINQIAGLPQQISSHSMRKTFANIILSCYDGSVEVEAIDKARVALNHTSLASTRHYLMVLNREVDAARKSVSDFILGKTDIDVLGVPKMKTNNELYDALLALKTDVDALKGDDTP